MAWTTPATFSAGATLTAAQLNTNLRDNLNAAFPAGTTWTAWVPTLANLTLGNGTQVARYIQVGSLVTFYWSFVLGSTSAVGTSPTFTFPVTASSSIVLNNTVGHCLLADAGTERYSGFATFNSTTVCGLTVMDSSTTYVSQTGITATVPFTWVTTDGLWVTGSYEAA